MTAASNPAAELTEALSEIIRLHDRVHMCTDHGWWNPQKSDRANLAKPEPCPTLVAARLLAGGAATDEGLRARVEALAADFDRRWAAMSVREVAAALHALADAAPAPTEDAHRPGCQEYPTGWLCVADCTTVWHDKPAVSRAADTAAEEPRTEAQAVGACGMYSCPRFQDGMCYCPGYEIKPKPDRLSRADEEAGS